MRKLTRDDDPYAIRDKIVPIYLRKILRRFKQLNNSLLGFDELNILSAVNATYEDVVAMTVDALKEIAKRTWRWVNGSDDGFFVDLWLAGFFSNPDPVTHYKFYDEADRKRSRLFEALESVTGKAERKKQIDIGLRYWTKQFEQTADDVVDAVIEKALIDNGVKYAMWVTMKDEKVCEDCHERDGKIYLIASFPAKPHYNCRCRKIPVSYKKK